MSGNNPESIAGGTYSREERKSCIVCTASLKYEILFRDIKNDDQCYSILVCPNCGLGITHPFPDKRTADRLYSSGQYRNHQSRFVLPLEKVIRFFRKSRRKKIEQLVHNGTILDIGCGRGVFLSIMREKGWKTFGTELNEDTAWHARSRLGLNVKTGDLTDAHFQDNFFDVVTLWHVLEHLPDPVRTMQECRRILRPGGLLVIALPNFDSLQARLSGRYWFHLDIPCHLYHFTVQNVLLLLEKSSFTVTKDRQFSFEFSPFGYLQSFLNMSRIGHNLLYNLLKFRVLRKHSFSKTRRWKLFADFCLVLLLLIPLIPVSIVLSVIESLLRRGGAIEVYAVKEDRG